MRKNAKAVDTGKTPDPLEAAKPKRGRKPKAGKQQEETGAAAETEAAQEAGQEPETAPEAAEMPAAETESTDAEQTEAPPETATEADTEPGNDTAEEPAAEDENAQEEEAGESNRTEESGEEPESLPAPAMSTVIDSPLKRMKQEFAERAQVIKEQMRNIQNAFITIGFQLHWIRENNMFRVLNYKNVYEYAEKEYGIKKTTCCNFISIVENYADRDENGNVIESISDCYRNYSASQLVAMLGMSDEMKQQVSPDMSVRAINRLRKGEPEEPTVEAGNPAIENAQEKENAPEPPADDAVPTEEKAGPEQGGSVNTPDGPLEEPAAYGNDIRAEKEEETGETGCGEEEPGEAAGNMEETPEGIPDGTLAEIDSYNDYRSMADELDLIMRHVFSVDAPVRVKIVCVQG